MLIRDVKKEPDLAEVGGVEATIKNCSAAILAGGEYTQCVNIFDHTGFIRAKFVFGAQRFELCNGTMVNIETAVRKDPGLVVLKFSIPTHSEPEPGSPYEWKPDENMTKSDWAAKDKRMAKMCSLNNATALVVTLAEIMKTSSESGFIPDTKRAANEFLNWIYE